MKNYNSKGCCGKGTSNKGSMPKATVKKSHMKHPTTMPDQVGIICKRAGTTDARELQRY